MAITPLLRIWGKLCRGFLRDKVLGRRLIVGHQKGDDGSCGRAFWPSRQPVIKSTEGTVVPVSSSEKPSWSHSVSSTCLSLGCPCLYWSLNPTVPCTLQLGHLWCRGPPVGRCRVSYRTDPDPIYCSCWSVNLDAFCKRSRTNITTVFQAKQHFVMHVYI